MVIIVGMIIICVFSCTIAICSTVFNIKDSQFRYEVRMHEINTKAYIKQQKIEQEKSKKKKYQNKGGQNNEN